MSIDGKDQSLINGDVKVPLGLVSGRLHSNSHGMWAVWMATIGASVSNAPSTSPSSRRLAAHFDRKVWRFTAATQDDTTAGQS